MRRALTMIRARAPGSGSGRRDARRRGAGPKRSARAVPDSPLTGTANLLIMPNLDAANIAFNLLKAAADGLPIGPMLLGMKKPIHVLVPSVTARGIVNLSALAVLERSPPISGRTSRPRRWRRLSRPCGRLVARSRSAAGTMIPERLRAFLSWTTRPRRRGRRGGSRCRSRQLL